MKNPFKDKNLTKARLEKLIAAAHAQVPPVPQDIEFQEYDWDKPHHYNPDNLIALDQFNKKLCKQFVKTMQNLCQGQFEVTVSEVRQDFACQLNDEIASSRQDHYFLPFMHEDREDCGFIGMSPETSVFFVNQMLREDDPSLNTGPRNLSELEEMIFLDLLSSMNDSIAQVFEQNNYVIHRGSKLSRSGWPVDYNGLEDLTTTTFSVQHPEGTVEFYVSMLSNLMNPIVGIDDSMPTHIQPERIKQAMLRQLGKSPISVTGLVCSMTMYLKDIMELGPGDVLLLKKSIHDPIEVLLNKKSCMRARIVASENRYSLLMTEVTDE